MRVLQAVERHRRRKRRLLATALAASFGMIATAAGWWLIRPGRAVDQALGVAVPDGCRVLREERAGDDDGAYEAFYVTSTWTVNEVVGLFEPRAVEVDDENRRFSLPDGVEVFVAPARDVPATRLSPIQPVTDGVPLGTRSWIVISRGTPPRSTWSVSVPPYGES